MSNMRIFHINVISRTIIQNDNPDFQWGAWASECPKQSNGKGCSCQPRKTGEVFFSPYSMEQATKPKQVLITFDQLKKHIQENGGVILASKIVDNSYIATGKKTNDDEKFKLKWILPPKNIFSNVPIYECIHNKGKKSTFKSIYNVQRGIGPKLFQPSSVRTSSNQPSSIQTTPIQASSMQPSNQPSSVRTTPIQTTPIQASSMQPSNQPSSVRTTPNQPPIQASSVRTTPIQASSMQSSIKQPPIQASSNQPPIQASSNQPPKQALSYAQVTIMKKTIPETLNQSLSSIQSNPSQLNPSIKPHEKVWSVGSGTMQDSIWTCNSFIDWNLNNWNLQNQDSKNVRFDNELFYNELYDNELFNNEPPGFELFSLQSPRTTSRLEMWMN